MKKFLNGITLLFLIVTACSAEARPTEAPSTGDETPTPTHVPVDLTPAQRIAITTLSDDLGLPVDEIKLVSTEAVDWPDGCLGVEEPELACTQVVTPGFRIILEANGRQVEYRTNQDGTVIRPATVAMSWKREGGIAGFCDYLTIYLSGEVHASSCKQDQFVEARLVDVLSQEELAQVEEWLGEYADVKIDASDPKGVSDRMVVTLMLTGTGSKQTLLASDKKDLLSFAQELFQRVNQ